MGEPKAFLRYRRQDVGHRSVAERVLDYRQLDRSRFLHHRLEIGVDRGRPRGKHGAFFGRLDIAGYILRR